MTASRSLKIFLSYAFDDRDRVKKLHAYLSAQGAKPWLDTEQLLPGQDWRLEIGRALDESDAVLLCLTRKSVGKEGYVQKELRLALDRALEMPEGRIFLIPARLEECEIPYSLKSYQWVDLFADGGMERLVKALNLRAKQVGTKPLASAGAPPPGIKADQPKKKPKRRPSSGTVVNIQGDVTGSTIVIGDDNKVDTD